MTDFLAGCLARVGEPCRIGDLVLFLYFLCLDVKTEHSVKNLTTRNCIYFNLLEVTSGCNPIGRDSFGDFFSEIIEKNYA